MEITVIQFLLCSSSEGKKNQTPIQDVLTSGEIDLLVISSFQLFHPADWSFCSSYSTSFSLFKTITES